MEKRLLVVDPDPATLSFLREKLTAANLRVRTATGGDEALAALPRENFDLILSALEMPHPNGLEILREARRLEQKQPVLLLARLGQDLSKIWNQVSLLPPVDLLERPIFLNLLYERIEFFLQMKIEWRERRATQRQPVSVELTLTIHGKTDTVYTVRTRTIDLSLGGLQFERKTCDVCTGYQKGAVHPDCILARFSMRPEGQPFPISLLFSQEKPMSLRARVAWTLIQEGTTREFVGLKFDNPGTDERERLRALLKKSPVSVAPPLRPARPAGDP